MSHILLQENKQNKNPPMIVLHGLLGNKRNWSSICQQQQIISKRDCYLVELRNHANSDHHNDFDHYVISDDIIRFADRMGLDTFTVMGHSLGGRAAMTTACRYPDRVDGIISIEAAPINSNNIGCTINTISTVEFMYNLKHIEPAIMRKEALAKATTFFNGDKNCVAFLNSSMDRRSNELKWMVNTDILYKKFAQIPFFDESLTFNKNTAYHLVGANST